jgi:RecJ-like exonuclease
MVCKQCEGIGAVNKVECEFCFGAGRLCDACGYAIDLNDLTPQGICSDCDRDQHRDEEDRLSDWNETFRGES